MHRNGYDLVKRPLKGWPDQIIHARINHNEVLFRDLFREQNARDQDPRISDNYSSRLKQNGAGEVFHQAVDCLAVFAGMRGGFIVVSNSESAAKVEVI